MTIEDIDLHTLEPQQGNKGAFRMTALDRSEMSEGWIYTFKKKDNTFFKIQVDRFNNRTLF